MDFHGTGYSAEAARQDSMIGIFRYLAGLGLQDYTHQAETGQPREGQDVPVQNQAAPIQNQAPPLQNQAPPLQNQAAIPTSGNVHPYALAPGGRGGGRDDGGQSSGSYHRRAPERGGPLERSDRVGNWNRERVQNTRASSSLDSQDLIRGGAKVGERCRYWARGYCPYGLRCHYVHSGVAGDER